MNENTKEARLAEALAVMREMAEQGHNSRYISVALNVRKLPTVSGRGKWHARSVWELMRRHGVPEGDGSGTGAARERASACAPACSPRGTPP